MHVQIDELFGAVESWRYTFGVLDNSEVEPPCPTSKLSLSPMLSSSPNFSFTEKISAAGISMRAPKLNDLLIVADPRIPDGSLPAICDILSSTEGSHRNWPSVENRLAQHRDVSPTSSLVWGQRELSRCLVLKNYISSKQFSSLWKLHPAMNSVAVLGEPTVEEFVMQYDLLFRSDNDCYITPAFHLPENIPWRVETKVEEEISFEKQSSKNADTKNISHAYEFYVGHGAYGSSTANKMVRLYSQMLHLRHQDISGIGSSWYGRPQDLVNVARLTGKVGTVMLKFDPVISRSNGEWPVWYRGVTLLYSAEIAINHLIDKRLVKIRGDLMDTLSTSNGNILEEKQLHIHCWHTDQFFSKFVFRMKKYSIEIFNHLEYDVNKINYYSFTNAWNGMQRRIAQEMASAIKTEAPYPSTLVEEMETELYMRCSATHPYSADGGQICCSEKPELDQCNKNHMERCVVKPCSPHASLTRKEEEKPENLPASPGECPATYPYPYQNGKFCCHYDQDCKASDIGYESECCRDHKFSPCKEPTQGCRLHPSVEAHVNTLGMYGTRVQDKLPAEEAWVDLGNGNKVREHSRRIKKLVSMSVVLKSYRKRLAEMGFI